MNPNRGAEEQCDQQPATFELLDLAHQPLGFIRAGTTRQISVDSIVVCLGIHGSSLMLGQILFLERFASICSLIDGETS